MKHFFSYFFKKERKESKTPITFFMLEAMFLAISSLNYHVFKVLTTHQWHIW
jgi:predicted membrane channel-forming protein YqfA (hemolysin III family)